MTRPTRTSTHGNTPLDEDGGRILRAASLAASSHNSQPWLVKVHEPRRWTVCGDPDRRLPAVDPENKELVLSLGTFLENLIIAAGAAGYAVEMDTLTDDPMALELVEVRLVDGAPTGYPTERITSRRTLRNDYSAEAIGSEDVDALLAPFDGRAEFYAQDSAEGKYLNEGTLEAFRQQTWRDDAQRELAKWIHFDSEEAEQHRAGLTPASMEITGFAGWFVRTFYDSERVMSDSFRERGIEGVAEQVAHAGGWIVVTAEDERVPCLIDTGRRLERMLLTIRELDIAAHPMSQMLEESPWKEQIAGELGVSGVPRFVVRVGYVNEYPVPVSLRRPVAWFVEG